MKRITTIPDKETYTAEDYQKLPEGAPYELINGGLVEEPGPSYGHQAILRDVFAQIVTHLQETKKGEVICAPLDVYFDDKNVFQPDIVYIANENTGLIKDNGIHGAPDMIIEFLSPASAYYDQKVKKRIYEKHGVNEYWIINPDDHEVNGFENINRKFKKLHKGFGRFSSKILNLDISLDLK